MKVNLIVIVPGCAKSIADNFDSAVDVEYVYNQKILSVLSLGKIMSEGRSMQFHKSFHELF